MRIRIIKDHPKFKKGEIIEATKNEAFGLIDSGYAMVDKSMTSRDYRTRKAKRGHTV